ncbi:hypothetical protein [Sporosarcina sp. Te-1]|uniref:hypothetical protein n=1 Tax=Sporosarcina sp. Te-1 TaxID=2818390 RepID=UPI001A9D0C79|nr:hypothetical protein [Sporosarcina sp. Te-1]QTD42083.1 hypothetical protein J3U78_04415 [Sporosarcina sp. Te-1]
MVSGTFKAEYDDDAARQVVSKVDNITSKIAGSSSGEWEQIFYDASVIDRGQKVRIQIEGIFSLNNISTEKAFIIEFSCDERGKIN